VDDVPRDGERRAPSSAAGAASIQVMSAAARRRPSGDGGPPAIAGPPDPVSQVERMLASGQLRDQGEQTRGGRRVRVLTRRWTRGDGKEILERTTIEYLVDADTFAPIAATVTSRVDSGGEVTSAKVRATFAGYRRIPLTRDSAKLLEIKPERPPKVVELTIDDIKSPPSP
jgi:hypothetical protein